MGDLISLQTADGMKWTMPDGERFITAYGGWGAPDVTYITSTSFRKDSVQERGWVYEPRALMLTLKEKTCSSRAAYWEARRQLIDLFRFNRGGPLTLTLRTLAGMQRSISVIGDPGPTFDGVSPDGDIWNIEETIALVAFNPIWRNPVTKMLTASQYAASGFIFPITFPITFGIAGVQFLFPITYAGSFDAYPTFTLTGPYSSAVFSSDMIPSVFTLDVPIGAAATRIVTLDPTRRSIVNASGADRINDLADGSDLVRFRLVPSPFAPGGVQTISVVVSGATVATSITMAYNEQFTGI